MLATRADPFPLEHAPFSLEPRPFRMMHARDNVYTHPEVPRSCTFYLTCENESTRDRSHMICTQSRN